jgi:hypothetical protein
MSEEDQKRGKKTVDRDEDDLIVNEFITRNDEDKKRKEPAEEFSSTQSADEAISNIQRNLHHYIEHHNLTLLEYLNEKSIYNFISKHVLK